MLCFFHSFIVFVCVKCLFQFIFMFILRFCRYSENHVYILYTLGQAMNEINASWISSAVNQKQNYAPCLCHTFNVFGWVCCVCFFFRYNFWWLCISLSLSRIRPFCHWNCFGSYVCIRIYHWTIYFHFLWCFSLFCNISKERINIWTYKHKYDINKILWKSCMWEISSFTSFGVHYLKLWYIFRCWLKWIFF